ncbi:diguanylate cyclase [Hyphomicrobium nitrativorans NL23]|uniref:Diguanylate cyclase n=1 Tax=Hyphomicrobium nitrativorans NL23 TaxID=1029756 RepID=V5SAY2_9HYPH|nr:bifunctional diguanylate cyclase/phosphodiesterase [Hyphomicrobium nitrativorans]AHB47607.1 diguanylate cyclase [Hyphomicrobium nitrativorans NL23]
MPHAETKPEPERETSYVWDLPSDRLDWQANAANVLGVIAPDAIATGEKFAARIVPEHQALWRSSVLGARASVEAAHGIAYHVQIAIETDGESADGLVWMDVSGRWWPDATGRPTHATGVLRRVDARFLEDRHLLGFVPDDETREGLHRTRLFEALGVYLTRAQRAGGSCGLFMMSANGLDAINARLGPDVGDEFISAIGRLIKTEIGETGVVVRYASNVFAAVLDRCDGLALTATAERIISRVERGPIVTPAGPLKAAIAIGAVALPEHVETSAEGVACARAALERAKRAQRSICAVHNPKDDTPQCRDKTVTGEVIAALEEHRLLLALQPIVKTADGQTAGYEALLRLRKTDGALITAADFLEEAEELGLAPLLDRRALELALALLKTHPRLKLCLNVSCLTAGDRNWLATLHAEAARDPGLPSRLTVEITETAMIHDLETVRTFVDRLHATGCKIAIDDFGTGYTSFRHLKTLPIDMLKIDGLFMKNLPDDTHGRVIVKSMIDMAKGLGIETVAEWVSDGETAAFLTEAGATYLQGFLYGNPETAEKLAREGRL